MAALSSAFDFGAHPVVEYSPVVGYFWGKVKIIITVRLRARDRVRVRSTIRDRGKAREVGIPATVRTMVTVSALGAVSVVVVGGV